MTPSEQIQALKDTITFKLGEIETLKRAIERIEMEESEPAIKRFVQVLSDSINCVKYPRGVKFFTNRIKGEEFELTTILEPKNYEVQKAMDIKVNLLMEFPFLKKDPRNDGVFTFILKFTRTDLKSWLFDHYVKNGDI